MSKITNVGLRCCIAVGHPYGSSGLKGLNVTRRWYVCGLVVAGSWSVWHSTDETVLRWRWTNAALLDDWHALC